MAQMHMIKTKDGIEMAISEDHLSVIESCDLNPEEVPAKTIYGIMNLYSRLRIAEDMLVKMQVAQSKILDN